MWVFTSDGFFSAVEHPDGALVVRCRDRGDGERLAARLTRLGSVALRPEVVETPARDYRYRLSIGKRAWADYLESEALAIDYPNFKSMVMARFGIDRERLYERVWSIMLSLQPARWSRSWDDDFDPLGPWPSDGGRFYRGPASPLSPKRRKRGRR